MSIPLLPPEHFLPSEQKTMKQIADEMPEEKIVIIAGMKLPIRVSSALSAGEILLIDSNGDGAALIQDNIVKFSRAEILRAYNASRKIHG